MAVPDAHLLLAVRRADARIHIEHDAARPAFDRAQESIIGRTGWQEAERFSGAASHCVSKRPIWLGEAALP